jgi:hypothetical protein
MKSPLSVDKAIVKEFGITPSAELHPRQKLAFLEDQMNEIKAAQWRARVDIIHATRLQESDVDALKFKGNNNMAEHRNQVQQFSGAVTMIEQLIKEIRAENPDITE